MYHCKVFNTDYAFMSIEDEKNTKEKGVELCMLILFLLLKNKLQNLNKFKI